MISAEAAPPPFLPLQLLQDFNTSFLQMDPMAQTITDLEASPTVSDEDAAP